MGIADANSVIPKEEQAISARLDMMRQVRSIVKHHFTMRLPSGRPVVASYVAATAEAVVRRRLERFAQYGEVHVEALRTSRYDEVGIGKRERLVDSVHRWDMF